MALVRRQQVGDGINNRVINLAFTAVQRAADYLPLIFLLNRQMQLSLAYRTDQYVHKLPFHNPDYITIGHYF